MAQNTYAVSWFKVNHDFDDNLEILKHEITKPSSQGKELNMVFGFQLSVARVGSTVNFLIMGLVLI